MIASVGKAATRLRGWLRRKVSRDFDAYLRRLRGVIHVGANVGQERDLYDRLGLAVLWIEPIPETFLELQSNISAYPRQRALNRLVTDRDDATYAFHVSNAGGVSSSILQLGNGHREIWPDIQYVDTLTLQSVTLSTLLTRESIAVGDYDGLVLDAQGAEMLILQGAAPLLRHFSFITAEAADFPAYEACPHVDQISEFLALHGFREYARNRFATNAKGGCYYNVTYRRRHSRLNGPA